MIEFQCKYCGAFHKGVPSIGWPFPADYLEIEEPERAKRVLLSPDACVIDGTGFYIQANLDIPVRGEDEPLRWQVWMRVEKPFFEVFHRSYFDRLRAHHPPLFGWVAVEIWPYKRTMNLEGVAFLRNNGERPQVVLEPVNHTLVTEQQEGISTVRAIELYGMMTHPELFPLAHRYGRSK